MTMPNYENCEDPTDNTTVDRLTEIKEEIGMLLDEAERLVRHSGNRMAYDRAKSYWLAHMVMALTKESDYCGSSEVTMECTIKELQNG